MPLSSSAQQTPFTAIQAHPSVLQKYKEYLVNTSGHICATSLAIITSYSGHNSTVSELAHLRSDLQLFSSVPQVSCIIRTVLDGFDWNAVNVDDEADDEPDEDD